MWRVKAAPASQLPGQARPLTAQPVAGRLAGRWAGPVRSHRHGGGDGRRADHHHHLLFLPGVLRRPGRVLLGVGSSPCQQHAPCAATWPRSAELFCVCRGTRARRWAGSAPQTATRRSTNSNTSSSATVGPQNGSDAVQLQSSATAGPGRTPWTLRTLSFVGHLTAAAVLRPGPCRAVQ